MAKQLAVPSVALAIGVAMMPMVLTRTVGRVIVFFGFQSMMNLMMKALLSTAVVSEGRRIEGFPAAFFITGVQQVTSLSIFLLVMLVLRPTRWRYTPRYPTKSSEWFMVAIASVMFTLSIALNNFSLMFLPISVNLVIRACCPLVIRVVEKVVYDDLLRPLELTFMCAGALCAGAVGVACTMGGIGREDRTDIMFGTMCCITSLLACSANAVLTNHIESDFKLSALDLTMYMTFPAFLMLVLPTFLVEHRVDWPGYAPLTDWAVVGEVVKMNRGVAGLAVLSGIFACGYNVLIGTIMRTVSSDHVVFTSTFNKAATIVLALSVGLEVKPLKPWDTVLLLGVTGNMLAFMVYSISSSGSKRLTAFPRTHEKGWVPQFKTKA